MRSTTVSDLVSHYRERELDPDTVWKTYSTKVTYEGYLNKWILPRREAYPLIRVNAGEVELWLRSLPLARSSCAKIRNLMSVVFNHGIRYLMQPRNRFARPNARRIGTSKLLGDPAQNRMIVARTGGIAGGGKGAAIGAGTGAGLGAGSEIMTKGDQVKIPSETLLDFTLQQSVTIPTQAS